MKENLHIAVDETEWLYVPNVEYHDYGTVKRVVQLVVPYRPHWNGGPERFPLVVYVPGSAWYRQELYNSVPSYSHLAERGFVVAVVQYRESTVAHFPAQVEDVERAVQFLVTKADSFHIDARNVFVAGNSSGGHTALMAALRSASGIIDAEGFDPAVVRGVVAQSAPSDMFRCLAEPLPSYLPPTFRPVKDLLGVDDVPPDLLLAREACCAPYISGSVALPPILLLHGTDDDQVNVAQSRALYGQLTAAGCRADYYELEGAGHGGAVFWSDAVLDIIAAFLRRNVVTQPECGGGTV